MARKKKINNYGTGIPYHEMEALARVLLPEIQAFFESEEGQREYAEWKAQQRAEQKNKAQKRREHLKRCSRPFQLLIRFQYYLVCFSLLFSNRTAVIIPIKAIPHL